MNLVDSKCVWEREYGELVLHQLLGLLVHPHVRQVRPASRHSEYVSNRPSIVRTC